MSKPLSGREVLQLDRGSAGFALLGLFTYVKSALERFSSKLLSFLGSHY